MSFLGHKVRFIMANELGTWGVVTEPYVSPLRGPEYQLPYCGCVTYQEGAPDSNTTGINNDVIVDTVTGFIYQLQNGTWVQIGGGGAVQVFSGHYGGEMPVAPVPDSGVTAALNYDLDPPYKQWKWSGTEWSG